MASFCAFCGSPVPSEMKFCTNCGKPVAAPSVAAPTAVVPIVSEPVVTEPVVTEPVVSTGDLSDPAAEVPPYETVGTVAASTFEEVEAPSPAAPSYADVPSVPAPVIAAPVVSAPIVAPVPSAAFANSRIQPDPSQASFTPVGGSRIQRDPSSRIQPDPSSATYAPVQSGVGIGPAPNLGPAPGGSFGGSRIQPDPSSRIQPDPSVATYAPVQSSGGIAPAPVAGGSGGILKLVLIVVAAIVCLFLLVGGFVGYKIYSVAKAVKNSVHTDSDGRTTLTTSDGTYSSGGGSAANANDLGVPIYPGATAGAGGLNLKNKSGSFVTVVFKTTDDVDSVEKFYKSSLPDAEETTSANRATVFKSGDSLDRKMISITPDLSQGTKIVIMRTQAP